MVGGWHFLTSVLISPHPLSPLPKEGMVSTLGLLRLPFSDCFLKEWLGEALGV